MPEQALKKNYFVILEMSPSGGTRVEAVCTEEAFVRDLLAKHEADADAKDFVLVSHERPVNWSFRYGDLVRRPLEADDG